MIPPRRRPDHRPLPRAGRPAFPAAAVLFLLLAATTALSGCDALPDSGPVEAGILHGEQHPLTNPMGFRIVPLTPGVIDALAAARPPGLSALGAAGARAPAADRIGPGDVLQVSIFELGSGLFAGGGAGGLSSGGANPLTGGGIGPSTAVTSEALPPIAVDATGSVDVPYVGPVQAGGRTTGQVADAIRDALKGKSQNPQVLVRISTDLANSVVVSGDVKKPGREPLTLAHERLLDTIAIAGGPDHAPEDTEVRLLRAGRSAALPLRELEDQPDQNVPLLPGDRVQLTYRPRSFTVFGAAGKVSETPFNTPELSLAQGLARIGGPIDERADPNGVFLFRFEDPAAAVRLGLPAARTLPALRAGAPAGIPVIYKLDLMDPTSYFVAQRFAMRDGDLVYVSNARTNRFYKFLNLVGTVISPAITGIAISR